MKFVLLSLLCACSGSAITDTHPVTDQDPTASREPVPEPVNRVPGGHGFWCTELRTDPGSVDHDGECYRVESTCEAIRKKAIAAGVHATACVASERAHCFTITDAERQRVHWRCYDSNVLCLSQRRKFRNEHPDYDFTTCDISAQAPRSPMPHTAAMAR